MHVLLKLITKDYAKLRMMMALLHDRESHLIFGFALSRCIARQ